MFCRSHEVRFLAVFAIFLSLATFVDGSASASTKTEQSNPFPQIDSIVQQAISSHQIPGAVILVGHDGRAIYRRAFGWRSLEPRLERMTPDTIFDLASLTKVIVTTTCVMRLVELGQVRLSDPVTRYIPEFGVNGKEYITVRDLLTHYSGLAPDIDLNRFPNDYRAALQLAFDEDPLIPPEASFIYSDTNFMVLGALVQRISGMPLNKYADAHIFLPLGMSHTRFLPPASWISKIAPTEYDENGLMLRGVVHDPRARRMGGIAGHAGLFSTADDLARFAEALLDGRKILLPKTIKTMTMAQQPPTSTTVRGLGWDIDSPLSSNRGELLPVGSYGHTGWTGTSLWIDPVTHSYIIILSNSVHPNGKGNAVALRSKIATTVAAYLPLTPSEEKSLRAHSITGYNEAKPAGRSLQAREDVVKTGLDILETGNFNLDLFRSGETKRIGLLTSAATADSQGERTIDVLARAPGVALNAIFVSDYGNSSALEDPRTSTIQNPTNDIPVVALNCSTDKTDRLATELFKSLDALFVDIQDSGSVTNSCLSLLGYVLEAAADAGTEIIVLDRPNPITGSLVQGPLTIASVSDRSRASYSVPIRHGMTIAELAQMLNSELDIQARLRIIPMQGWNRSDWFDATSLTWTDPSADVRNLTEATLYPGATLLENSNVSIGRGTDMPFQLVGAPWINPRELASYLNARHIAGIRFIPTKFTPRSGTYAGKQCSGVNIIVVDRSVLDAPEFGIEMASALHTLYPTQFELTLDSVSYDSNAEMHSAPAAGALSRIASDWHVSINEFEKARQKYLLYK